jgi:hypothetical protein
MTQVFVLVISGVIDVMGQFHTISLFISYFTNFNNVIIYIYINKKGFQCKSAQQTLS